MPLGAVAAVRSGLRASKRYEVERYREQYPDRLVDDDGNDLGPLLPSSTPAPLMPLTKRGRYGSRRGSTPVGRIVMSYRKRKAVNFVKRAIRRWAEMKHVTFQVGTDFTNNDSLSSNGVFQQVSGMAQGTTDATRVGNQVELAWLMFNLQFTHIANTFVAGAVRIIIFVDHQASTQPTPATILQGASAIGAWTLADVYRTYNLDNVSHGVGPQRIRILYDKVLEINAANSNTTATVVRHVKGRINLRNMKQFFNGTTATDQVTNKIWFFAIGANNNTDLTAGQIQTCYFDA